MISIKCERFFLVKSQAKSDEHEMNIQNDIQSNQLSEMIMPIDWKWLRLLNRFFKQFQVCAIESIQSISLSKNMPNHLIPFKIRASNDFLVSFVSIENK